MSFIVEELVAGIPEPRELVSLTIRLLFAIVLGAVVGFQREHSGKTADFARTCWCRSERRYS